MKKVILFLLIVAILGGGAYWYFGMNAKTTGPRIAYRTQEVTQGQVREIIRATGTIEPDDLIDVGAQVTGQIIAFGKDINGNEIDYCSQVKKGQLLARIDDVTYKAEVTKAKATLATAQADRAAADADVAQLNAKLKQAKRDWDRAQTLGIGDALSQKDYDAYLSAYEVAVANLAVGQASIKQADAKITSAQADLEKAERNLSYCDILATVDGTIIDRRVNIGQTVTASMSTPSLFLVAKDLREIQIWVPVNEADIGSIKIGQRVDFTVDAFANKTFKGTVSRIRLNASMSSNVVTYTVEISTGNEDGLLLPYLTANVSFILKESTKDAIMVPASALVWEPSNWKAPEGFTATSKIFVQDEKGQPVPVAVVADVSDDSHTSILSSDPVLEPGDSVIVAEMSASEIANAQQVGGNPFMPKPPKWGKPRPRQ